MKSIVYPTDFSEYSLKALRWAVEFAKTYDWPLKILHTTQMPTTGAAGGVMVNLREKLIEESQANLDALLKRFETEPQFAYTKGVKIDGVCEYESTVEGIIGFAEDENAGLIVMGTRGASGIGGDLIGSNAATVIAKAQLPVLAIPEHAEFSEIKKIAFATNLAETEFHYLKRLTELASRFGASIEFLHITTPEESFEDEEVEAFIEKIKTEIEYDNVTLKLVKANEVEEGIVEYVDGGKVDILIMLRRKRSFWQKLFQKSHTRSLALHTHTPLLVYHVK